jgi:exodeoxyribonuclease VII large subunit
MRNPIKTYTVSQVNALIKTAISTHMPARFVVRAQILNWKHHHSGHCYFSLKDKNSILPAVMWASKFKSVKFEPEEGMDCLATGYIDVYTVGGKYQLYVEKLEPKGVGALQLAFEQMVAKLETEGLFADEHKQPLPSFARRIGVLTSESGAAIHDITDSIFDRWPPAEILLFPVPVQGDGAARSIADRIRQINRENNRFQLDLLIVGRGGGSQEDLWAFNEEVLARAIFGSNIPLISAVGHEVDTTVADLVADARASTPTKAGVVAVPDAQEVLEQINHMQNRLTYSIKSTTQLCAARLTTVKASGVFKRPQTIVLQQQQRLDELAMRMNNRFQDRFQQLTILLNRHVESVLKLEPQRFLSRCLRRLDRMGMRIQAGFLMKINAGKMSLETKANRLQGMNPKSVLKRGYSITTHRESGRLLRSSADVRAGDIIRTELADENLVESQVTKK